MCSDYWSGKADCHAVRVFCTQSIFSVTFRLCLRHSHSLDFHLITKYLYSEGWHHRPNINNIFINHLKPHFGQVSAQMMQRCLSVCGTTGLWSWVRDGILWTSRNRHRENAYGILSLELRATTGDKWEGTLRRPWGVGENHVLLTILSLYPASAPWGRSSLAGRTKPL